MNQTSIFLIWRKEGFWESCGYTRLIVPRVYTPKCNDYDYVTFDLANFGLVHIVNGYAIIIRKHRSKTTQAPSLFSMHRKISWHYTKVTWQCHNITQFTYFWNQEIAQKLPDPLGGHTWGFEAKSEASVLCLELNKQHTFCIVVKALCTQKWRTYT